MIHTDVYPENAYPDYAWPLYAWPMPALVDIGDPEHVFKRDGSITIFKRPVQNKIFKRPVQNKTFKRVEHMKKIENYTKQPWEEERIAGEFTDDLDDGETISSSTVSAVDKDDNDVSTTVLDQATKTIDGGYVKIFAKGGSEAASPYVITFRATTSDGQKLEVDVRMRIEEKP